MDVGLTDGQTATIAAAIVAGFSTLGGLVRWSAGIIRDAMKESREAIRDNTSAFAKLTEWLGRVDVRVQDSHSRVVEVHQEISDVHEMPMRASTSSDDDSPTPVENPQRKHPRARSPHAKPGTER